MFSMFGKKDVAKSVTIDYVSAAVAESRELMLDAVQRAVKEKIDNIYHAYKSTEQLQKDVDRLAKELEQLKQQKKMEEERIKHLVRLKEEAAEVGLQKKELELKNDFKDKEMKLQTDYFEKMMKQLEAAKKDMQDIYGKILERLPNVNMAMIQQTGLPPKKHS